MAKYQVEVTDTFGGEANYCWVNRYTIDGSNSIDKSATRKLVRDAKAAAGWTGLRCTTDNYGDDITIRPTGRDAPCWIMFVTYLDPQPEEEDLEAAA